MGDHIPNVETQLRREKEAAAKRAAKAAAAGTPSSGGQAENYASMVGPNRFSPFNQMAAAMQHHQRPRYRATLAGLAKGANNFNRNRERLLAAKEAREAAAAQAAAKPASTRGKCWGLSCSVMGGKRCRKTRRRSTRRRRN